MGNAIYMIITTLFIFFFFKRPNSRPHSDRRVPCIHAHWTYTTDGPSSFLPIKVPKIYTGYVLKWSEKRHLLGVGLWSPKFERLQVIFSILCIEYGNEVPPIDATTDIDDKEFRRSLWQTAKRTSRKLRDL